MTKAELEEEVRRLEARCAELEDQLATWKPKRSKVKASTVVTGDPVGVRGSYQCLTCSRHDSKGGSAPPMSRDWYCRDHLAAALDGKL